MFDPQQSSALNAALAAAGQGHPAELKVLIERLTRKLEYLYRQLGIEYPDESVPLYVLEAEEHVRVGRDSEAIKIIREHTCVGVIEARAIVEDISRRIGREAMVSHLAAQQHAAIWSGVAEPLSHPGSVGARPVTEPTAAIPAPGSFAAVIAEDPSWPDEPAEREDDPFGHSPQREIVDDLLAVTETAPTAVDTANGGQEAVAAAWRQAQIRADGGDAAEAETWAVAHDGTSAEESQPGWRAGLRLKRRA